jgi:hypothetical protein
MKTLLPVFLIALLFAAVAAADVIDLGATANNGGAGLSVYNLNRTGYSVQLSAGPATPPPPATLYWSSGAGYGVNYFDCILGLCNGAEDEVDGIETLTATFSVPVYLNSFTVSNYFNKTFLGFIDIDNETTGQFSINHGAWQDMGRGTSNGDLEINGPGVTSTVDSIGFRIRGGTLGDEFSVKELDVVPTPEPGSFLLLATVGAGSLLLARRRRKA